ncbi:uncharacterized protein PAC_07821 [Phialocephala subalpina]|uniref:Sialidase domain-containing protein n=1 Tax=Phialocephala subalpina TaxID=576137 RepID=A0A1L7WYU9_9HELO|nr:uncharacterized protein PAC_07821 [Phialocephala subalpina]
MISSILSLAFLFALLSCTSVASILPPDEYWQVTPPLNYSDVLYAGWDQIPVEKEVLIYNGTLIGRTYAHHPQLLAVGPSVYMVHSSAVIDEDSMGMELWGAMSHDGGYTWTPSHSILPAALLPNQTNVANFSYWCNEAIWQRAIGGLAVLEVDSEIWGVGETTDFFCWGDIGSGTRGAGRIARQLSTVDGMPIGDPCWLNQNNWTYIELYNETVYGTEYGMKFCEKADEMNAQLVEPTKVPAWSAWLYNDQLYAANNWSSLQEVTHSVWIEQDDGPGYWQRFWRDISPTNNSMRVWWEMTYDKEGKDWYPGIEEAYGNKVYETNIPDAKTKQFLGVLDDKQSRYLISNPRNNTELIRQPLTIAMSRGSDLSYKTVGVLRTNASDKIAPDTRDYKNQGFSYPVAVQVGHTLVTAYSENKENIWVSVVNIDDLP